MVIENADGYTAHKEIFMKYAKYGLAVLTLALVMGFTTPRAAAQEQFNGKFTLTTEAYWGPTLLPPGDYAITVSADMTSGVRPVEVKSESMHASILTGPVNPEPVSEHNAIELEQINGVYVIRQLDAGIVGQSFRFAVSKNARAHAERTSTSAMLTVPVTTSGSH